MTISRRSLRVGQIVQLMTHDPDPRHEVSSRSSSTSGLRVAAYRVEEIEATHATLSAVSAAHEPSVRLPLSYLLSSPDVTWLGDADRDLPSQSPDETLLLALPASQAKVVEKRLGWVRRIREAAYAPYSASGRVPLGALEAEAAADLGCTPRSVRRYKQAYQSEGLAGLIDGRAKHAGAKAKGGSEVFQVIAELLHETRDRSLTDQGLIRELRAKMSLDSTIQCDLSESTLRRYLHLTKSHLAYESNPKRRLNASRTNTTPTRPYSPASFGEILELDEHILDIQVHDPHTGRIFRPHMHVLLEPTTEMLVSMRLLQAPATAIDAGFLLYDALIFTHPTDTSEGQWSVTTSWDSAQSIRDFAAGGDYGPRPRPPYVHVPRAIRSDNASIYTATNFVDAAMSLGIQILPAKPYRPTDKARVERFFGTIETELIQHLPGAIGHSVADRPTQQFGAAQRLLSMPALEQVIACYINEVWMETPRADLVSIGITGARLTPRDALKLQLERTGFVDALVDPYAPLALLPHKYAALSNTMITVNKLRYSNAELGRLRDLPTPDKANQGKYQVRYDPRDISGVWVLIPEAGDHTQGRWTWATCRSVTIDLPFSLSDWQAAQEVARASGRPRKEDVLQEFITRAYTGETLDAADAKAASLWMDRVARATADRITHLAAPVANEINTDEIEHVEAQPLNPTKPFEDYASFWSAQNVDETDATDITPRSRRDDS
jgi:hypothetical protein